MVSQIVAVDVKDRLLDAAQDVIVEEGPRAATISAIATRAGVSRMTVYRKFPDRHALLSELFNRELGQILDSAMQPQEGTYVDRIAALVVAGVAGINGHPLMQAVLGYEPEQLTEWITGRLGRTQRRARDVLTAMVAAGQAEGSVRPGDCAQMALTLVLVAQTFVFAERIGGNATELELLVKGYLS